MDAAPPDDGLTCAPGRLPFPVTSRLTQPASASVASTGAEVLHAWSLGELPEELPCVHETVTLSGQPVFPSSHDWDPARFVWDATTVRSFLPRTGWSVGTEGPGDEWKTPSGKV